MPARSTQVRSASANYTGYRVSFAAGAMSPSYSCAGGGALPGSRGCFKADFSIPDEGMTDFVEVRAGEPRALAQTHLARLAPLARLPCPP